MTCAGGGASAAGFALPLSQPEPANTASKARPAFARFLMLTSRHQHHLLKNWLSGLRSNQLSKANTNPRGEDGSPYGGDACCIQWSKRAVSGEPQPGAPGQHTEKNARPRSAEDSDAWRTRNTNRLPAKFYGWPANRSAIAVDWLPDSLAGLTLFPSFGWTGQTPSDSPSARPARNFHGRR